MHTQKSLEGHIFRLLPMLGQTDPRQIHKPYSAYYVSNANEIKRQHIGRKPRPLLRS